MAQRSNPVTYLTLISQEIFSGPVQHLKITKEESHSSSFSFSQRVIHENSFSLDSKTSVGGIIDVFNISNDTEVKYATYSKTDTRFSKHEADFFATKCAWEGALTRNQYFVQAAEMKMYVFKDPTSVTKHIVLPTGVVIVGAYSLDNLLEVTLDETWKILLEHSGWIASKQCYSIDQLQQQIEKGRIPTIKNEFPDPTQWYFIKNTQYPGSRIGKWGTGDSQVGCGTWADNEDQHWRFEKHDGGYLIFNRKYSTARLAQWGTSSANWGTYAERIYEDQVWILQYQGQNKVTISNKKYSGYRLAKWGTSDRGGTGVYNGPFNKDQVWELVRV